MEMAYMKDQLALMKKAGGPDAMGGGGGFVQILDSEHK